MLVPCPNLNGDCEIDTAPPQTALHENAFYLPQSTPHDLPPVWGIYDTDGRLIEAAAYKRGPGRKLIGQADTIDVPAEFDIVEEEFIYGGTTHGHYGHFLLDVLPRFWIDFASLPDRRILVHSCIDLDVMFSVPHIREIFAVLALDRSRFVTLDRPSLVRRLLVPDALFVHMSSAKPLFAQLCGTINARMNPPTPRTRGALYLSKQNLNRGVWCVVNEDRIAARLAEKGIDVMYPEQTPLREQMAVFERYETICGLTGSALHTSLFARLANRIVGLSRDSFVMSNYRLIDQIKSNSATYVYPEGSMVALGRTENFMNRFECPEPEQVADELFDML